MALTFNSGMNLLASGDSLSPTSPVAGDWVRISINSTNTNTLANGPVLDNDLFVQGSGSIAGRRQRDNTECGIGFLTDSALDLTATGNEVIGVWFQCTTPTFLNAQDAAATNNATRPGISVFLSSSATSGTANISNWNAYSVGGVENPTNGWKFYLIDTRQTPSRTSGTCNLAAIRSISVCIGYGNIPRNPRSDNIFVDAIYYGRPQYQVIGDGVETATFADFATDSSNATDGSNGLIERVGSTYFTNCGFKFGSSTQTATTTFLDDSSATIVMRRNQYYSQAASSFVEALRYEDYYDVVAEESGSFSTSVTLGSVVGTGDDRQGVLGGTISTEDLANMRYAVDMSNVTSANFYGVDLKGAKDGISFEGGQNLIGTQLINCGPLNTGTTSNGVTFLNSFVIDPQSQDGTNIGINVENTSSGGSLTTNLKNLGFITSGTPTTQRYVGFNENGDFTVSFDNLVYYGDFSSGTIYHGQNAGTNSDITINSVNGSNVLQSEFENLNGATTTVVTAFDLNVTGLLGNTEVRVYDNPSLFTGGGSSTEIAGVETVAAVTQTNTASVYLEYNAAAVTAINSVGGGADLSSIGLADGDTLRVTVRDNSDNPTLQVFDEFTVNGTPTASSIPVDSTTGTSFASVLVGSNTKIVTVEKVNATQTFSVSSGTYDIFVYRIGSLPIITKGFQVTENSRIPISQSGDRVYKNPA